MPHTSPYALCYDSHTSPDGFKGTIVCKKGNVRKVGRILSVSTEGKDQRIFERRYNWKAEVLWSDNTRGVVNLYNLCFLEKIREDVAQDLAKIDAALAKVK